MRGLGRRRAGAVGGGAGAAVVAANGESNGSSKSKTASAPAADSNNAEPLIVYSGTSKPDRGQYDEEQNKIKAALAAKQAQLVGCNDVDIL